MNMRKIEPKTDEMMESSPIGMKKGKPQKIYPHITLRHEFFPETKKWEVGKTYKVEMEMKMTGLSISRFQNDSEFEVTGFGSKDTKEDNEE